MVHIAAGHANDAFSDHININIKDVCVDVFYWFVKSAKCKSKLLEYFQLFDQEFQSILKHLSVQWLSLEHCLLGILKQLPSFCSYLLSEEFRDDRFQRLQGQFSKHLLEPAILFNQAIFTNFNLLLQIEEPNIYLLKLSMKAVAWKLANRIVKPTILRNMQSISELDLDDNSIYLARKSIFLGGMTKAKLEYMLK